MQAKWEATCKEKFGNEAVDAKDAAKADADRTQAETDVKAMSTAATAAVSALSGLGGGEEFAPQVDTLLESVDTATRSLEECINWRLRRAEHAAQHDHEAALAQKQVQVCMQ